MSEIWQIEFAIGSFPLFLHHACISKKEVSIAEMMRRRKTKDLSDRE